MPDYSLPQNNNAPTHQQLAQPQSPQQTPSAISQLSAVSQQSKLETENALLREALAKSAQNCEALITQLAESQKAFIQMMTTKMTELQHQTKRSEGTAYHSLKEMREIVEEYGQSHSGKIDRYSEIHHNLIEQHSQSHQSRLLKLENMNEAFNRNLKSVLTTMTDKIIAQVSVDAKSAFNANCDTMTNIIKTMEIASTGVTDMVEDFNKNLNAAYKKSKTILDNRAKGYHSAMDNLFKVDGWRQMFFWLGICGGILTPIVLIVGRFL
jgi:hypothetical protein